VRAREMNLMLHDLARERNVAILDADAIAADLGTQRHAPDGIHGSGLLETEIRGELIRLLRQRGVAFTGHLYAYEEHGGTRVSARELAVEEHAVVKTLVMEDEAHRPLVVLMHGDRKVSTKELARQIGAKKVEPCRPEAAQRHTGYLVGGTSPFGLRKPLPVWIEKSILELPRIYINGGRRGFLVGIAPEDVLKVLDAKMVDCAIE
jgi:Cys-tRNA(Pro) deacylase